MNAFSVVNRRVAENILFEDSPLLDQELADFYIAASGGEVKRGAVILVIAVDIETLKLEIRKVLY